MLTEKYTARDVEQIKLIMQSVVSLNIPARTGERDEELDELGAFIVDTDPGPEELYLQKERSERIDKYLNKFLTKREVHIIRERFGFDDRPKSLEEVAQEIGLTRERVRQLEMKALRKLRAKFAKEHLTAEDL